MSLSGQSRRGFLRAVATSAAGMSAFGGGGGAIGGRGLEAMSSGEHEWEKQAPPGAPIRLDSNENPHGPAREAIDAVVAMFAEANRYPFAPEAALKTAVAARHRVPEDHVILGAGSGEILKMVTEACVSPSRPLVTASPTFEIPTRTATRIGAEVRAPRVTASLGLDLQAMYDASRGAGLVFVCNPNNPTGSVHSLSSVTEFISRVRVRSPDTHVLVDEAYFEYVDDPGYGTALGLALRDARVIVARTFSKVFGLAGLRAGYAIARPETIARLAPYRVGNSVSVLGAAAAVASIPLSAHLARQRQLNAEARDFASREIAALGFTVPASNTNFVMFDIRRDVAKFRDACRERGLAIGRVFEPLTMHARISIGTMEEMRRALAILGETLRA